jgi:carboxylesterase
MMTTTWADWTKTAEQAYDELAERCERVAVVGLSMGGGLAAYLAEERPTVAGCVLINPLVKPPVPELYDGLVSLLDAGIESIESIGSDVKKEGVIESSYDATPLVPAKSLFEGVTSVHEKLGQITAPILLLSSREDHVVTSDNGDDLVTSVSGPLERVWLENSYHVATIDNDQELVESLTMDFLARVL